MRKHIFYFAMKRLYIIWLFVAGFGLSAAAYAQDFNTGSDLMNTGSSYSSSVGEVGANGVNDMYTTASSPTRTVGARKVENPGLPDAGYQGDSPIGEPFVMLFFAAAAAAVVALRRRKAQA